MGPSSLVGEVEPYALRGQTPEEARELSSRLDYWSAALPVWRESPLIGKGLLTGTRFEVLAPLGLTFTSGIHSTWVEALVGTGVIGLALVSLSFLITFKRAFVLALWSGDLVPGAAADRAGGPEHHWEHIREPQRSGDHLPVARPSAP